MSQNGNNALATRSDVVEGEVVASAIAPALTMVLDLNEMEKRYKLLQEFINRLMKDGHDYGVIPGTGNKPTLLLPGAHKLNSIYGLSPIVEILEAVEDFEGGFLKYNIKVKLVDKRNGMVVAEGIGSCNTQERRYANAIRAGKQTAADYANTCLKIAKKRALIDATLTATGTSGIFEQDFDDEPATGNHNNSQRGNGNQNNNQNANRQNPPQNQRQQRPDYNRPAAAVAVESCTQPQIEEIWRLANQAYPRQAEKTLQGWLQCPVEKLSKQRASEVIEELLGVVSKQAFPDDPRNENTAEPLTASPTFAPASAGNNNDDGVPRGESHGESRRMPSDDVPDPFADE